MAQPARQVALVLALMLVGFALLRAEFPWPAWLTWSAVPSARPLQEWLIDQRTAEDANLVFALFDGFRVFVDWLVTSLTDALLWLTWVGTRAAGTLIVLRFGGWRPALLVLAAFASFA